MPNPADRPQSAETVLWRLRAIRDRDRRAGAEDRFSVLIVDDDEAMHRTLAEYVRVVVPEAIIETAASGAQALRAVKKRVPHVLLLDLDLPDVNGVEVCMYLRGMKGADRCMVVAVSGRAKAADVALIGQFGASFIKKGPTLMNELILALDSVRPVGA
jgi:CheY-like chemotaxis protein